MPSGNDPTPATGAEAKPGHPERMTGKMEPVGDQKLEIEDLVMDGDWGITY
jgi:hypothetical protein